VLAAYIAAGLVLDQGREGACTGFGLACVVNYLLFRQGLFKQRQALAPLKTVRSAHACCFISRVLRRWPGEDYEGSSCAARSRLAQARCVPRIVVALS